MTIADPAMAQQLTYDTLEIGASFVSKGRTLTEADLTIYSMLTGDWNPIHSDAEYSKSTPAGARTFHGSFGIALALSMSAGLIPLQARVLAALGVECWTWKKPLLIGDTIRVRLTIDSKRVTSDSRRAIIVRRIDVLLTDGEVAQSGLASLMVDLG
ncbi:MAG: acyl dehydratase [Hyphomicrobiales bacterium]|nr:acyl dehydratase [Hyphomicrobiales bacterium]